ncbi:MAG: YceI family protein [Sandaracinobacteroides sp.]
MRRLIAPLLLLAAPAAATEWAVVPAQSSLGFSAEWNGQKVEGRFPKFQAAIRFDPTKLADARVDAVIDLASATTADKTVNGSLPGSDWFDVKKSPTARFQSASFTQTKPGQYVARGTLTLRGVSVPVVLPFTLAITGKTAVMTGQTQFDRRAFKIGMDSDAEGAWVGFPIPVKVRITATAKP